MAPVTRPIYPMKVVKRFIGPNGEWITLFEILDSPSEMPFVLFSVSLN